MRPRVGEDEGRVEKERNGVGGWPSFEGLSLLGQFLGLHAYFNVISYLYFLV